jgi:hypothetical protein
MRKILFLIYSLVSVTTFAAIQLSDSAQIHLLTCTQGEQVWSKYGHTGIRVIDPANKLDVVFNYGIFSLMDDDFYIKFVKGETYYQLGIESYYRFMTFYSSIGRTTYWQELNLTTQQKQCIYDALMVNYLPKNRYYLYNFVFDNCATRPYHLIKQALQDSIISEYKGYINHDFRSTISHYTGPNSWVDFGINLVFGKDADQLMNNEQRLFLPEELMNYFAQAHLSDGTPLVIRQEIGPFAPVTVPWYANCWFGMTIFALLMLVISLYDRRKQRLTLAVDIILFIIYLLLISLVIFLTFFSCHPLVGFNWRLILLPIIHLCTRLVYWLR